MHATNQQMIWLLFMLLQGANANCGDQLCNDGNGGLTPCVEDPGKVTMRFAQCDNPTDTIPPISTSPPDTIFQDDGSTTQYSEYRHPNGVGLAEYLLHMEDCHRRCRESHVAKPNVFDIYAEMSGPNRPFQCGCRKAGRGCPLS